MLRRGGSGVAGEPRRRVPAGRPQAQGLAPARERVRHRARNGGYRLFFHDTHHRAATNPGAMAAYDLDHYDGVLAYGAVIRDLYLRRGWAADAWTWHEAADVRVFHPRSGARNSQEFAHSARACRTEHSARRESTAPAILEHCGRAGRTCRPAHQCD